jgi:hypothetical protein
MEYNDRKCVRDSIALAQVRATEDTMRYNRIAKYIMRDSNLMGIRMRVETVMKNERGIDMVKLESIISNILSGKGKDDE